MKTRHALMAALMLWLAAGVCLAGDEPASTTDNDPATSSLERTMPDEGMPPGDFDFDSGSRPHGRMFAQGPGSRQGFGGRHGDADWGDRRKHLEQLRILKMLEVLNLTEDQELEFLSAFRTVRKEHAELNQEKETLVDSLAAMLDNGKITEKSVNAVVDRILTIEDTKLEVLHDFVEKARVLLTPEQEARFVVFNERFERELLEQVKSFRDRRGPGPEPPTMNGEG